MTVNLVVLGKDGQASEEQGEEIRFTDSEKGQYSYSIEGGALLVWKADRSNAALVEVAYAPHSWIKVSGARKTG
ncbi:hypothetical protein AB0N81_30035 [Streptomyces sp. NPDC093510]|uniref:hypothetical protein n=1 Tax=Streptomyces sp. NPDC093510 TaxID=3155199 RepID=UPI00342D1BCD